VVPKRGILVPKRGIFLDTSRRKMGEKMEDRWEQAGTVISSTPSGDVDMIEGQD
jgi:hypothetical protein